MSEAVENLTALRAYLKTHAPFLADREDVSSGSSALDRLLLGGFPRGSLTVITGELGTGRMTLAAQALRRETENGRPVAWVDGEGLLYPPALALQGLDLRRMLIVRKAEERSVYALEQVLESGMFGMVAASGLDRLLTPSRLRRIQSATEGARVCALLVLEPRAAQQVTTAALKLRLTRRHRGIQVMVEKDRTGRAIGRRVTLTESQLTARGRADQLTARGRADQLTARGRADQLTATATGSDVSGEGEYLRRARPGSGPSRPWPVLSGTTGRRSDSPSSVPPEHH